MNEELKYFLEQGPNSVKELARVTGKSTSTIYKALKEFDGLQEREGPSGKQFFLVPEASVDVAPASDPANQQETPTQQANVSPAAPVKAGRGRKANAVGKTLTATVTDNPRRANSHGYKSLQIIIDNPGLTTEDYLAKGGRRNDLNWDIAHGNVKAEDAS